MYHPGKLFPFNRAGAITLYLTVGGLGLPFALPHLGLPADTLEQVQPWVAMTFWVALVLAVFLTAKAISYNMRVTDLHWAYLTARLKRLYPREIERLLVNDLFGTRVVAFLPLMGMVGPQTIPHAYEADVQRVLRLFERYAKGHMMYTVTFNDMLRAKFNPRFFMQAPLTRKGWEASWIALDEMADSPELAAIILNYRNFNHRYLELMERLRPRVHSLVAPLMHSLMVQIRDGAAITL